MMNRIKPVSVFSVLIVVMVACNSNEPTESVKAVDWVSRMVEIPKGDSLLNGKTYLSVYSQIYSESEHQTHNLTVTVSLRNTNSDTIFIRNADYYNTHGALVRSYFERPIRLVGYETVEIIIAELDKEGGTGGNFIFEWSVPNNDSMPLFEAIMISTSGQQGLSFRTEGVRIN